MGVLQMDRCHYCGAEVFYEEGQTLIRCRACGQTIKIAEFLSERLRFEKALEAERIAKQELERAREEARAAQERLNNTFQALEDLRNSNNLQEDQLQQVISSLDISKENQDALRKMLEALGETSQNEHAQITGLIRMVIDHQDTMTDKLQALRSFSNSLLEKSDNSWALISSLSDHLHSDAYALNVAIDKLTAWAKSTHDNDITFLQDIRTASNALLESQNQFRRKIGEIEKRQQATSDSLKRFESNWEKSKLDEVISLYHQAENLQADREYEKAAEYYRQVIVKGGKDPEVLWRIVQCHYGVNCQIDNEGSSITTLLCPDLSDPAEMSIRRELEDSLSTDEQKAYYHAELQKIDTILDKYRHYRHQVSYDIFISVKQKENGHYTDDSDIGSELYTHLVSQGYKVFNSRRSIPVGVEYEPYILAALLSSKVMIVVGSCPEYINSQWIKNEWSRFQWLQKHEIEVNGFSDRMLLCYLGKGMNPYDIPKALNPSYQAIIDGVMADRQLADALKRVFSLKPIPISKNEPEKTPEPKPAPKLESAPEAKSMPKHKSIPESKPVPINVLSRSEEGKRGQYQKVTEQKDSDALFSLEIKYENGEGVPQDYQEAGKWYRKAADKGNAIAQNHLGNMYLNGNGVRNNYLDAADWYKKAAIQGFAEAQRNLGNMYLNGNGVAQSYEEAEKWYRKAAEQGDAIAQNQLGNMCLYGKGVRKDYLEAVKWFRKAAEQGNAEAQKNLGNMYVNGIGVPRSNEEAVKWYRKAADQGYARAQNNLGIMYQNGDGVACSNTEAVKWYRKAAEQGDVSAQRNLGNMYYNGQGAAQNYIEAAKWYRKAAEQGYADAQKTLGIMYQNGEGVAQDYKEAVKWYRKAAEQGNADAQNNLGTMYYNGQGMAKDYEEAVKWYRKAAEQGHAGAQNNLDYMYKHEKIWHRVFGSLWKDR